MATTLAMLAGSSVAAAEDTDFDAERLFREGQKLMEERNFGAACPKFEAAYSKDRALGTLINLAYCHKEQGASWYAWLEFREAESKAIELNRSDRRDFVKQRLAELEKLLPKVVVDNPKKIPLTDVLVEDRRVWEAERAVAFAAESGERRLTFRAKGKKPATKIISVVRGEKVQHVSLPEMEDSTEEVVPTNEKSAVEPPAKKTRTGSSFGSNQRAIGWVAVGIGGVAAVVGTITGIMTLQNECAGNGCPKESRTAPQNEAIDSASASGAIATVSFVVAALGVGGGLVLIFTAPSTSSSISLDRSGGRVKAKTGLAIAPRLGPTWAGLAGTF